MQRVRTHIFILPMLLCGALMLGSVTFAKYQTETGKTLSAGVRSRWTPVAGTDSWTMTINGAACHFTIQNSTSTEKTVAVRVLIGEQESVHSELYIKTTKDGAESSTALEMHHMSDMGSTLQKAYGSSGYIYCADASGKEMTWTISSGGTLEGTIVDPELASVEGLDGNVQILVSQRG